MEYSGSYRIKIRLDALTTYRITPPAQGRGLLLDLANTDADPALAPRPASLGIIEQVWIRPGAAGVSQLEIDLGATEVEISDYSVVSPNPTIIIDLRTGGVLPVEANPGAPIAAALALPTSETIQSVTKPETIQSDESNKDIHRIATNLPSAVPSGGEQTIVPAFSSYLNFKTAKVLLGAFESGRFEAAYSGGVEALGFHQTQASKSSLLYFLAECRYQMEKQRSLDGLRGVPGWEDVLNHWSQAIRFDPRSPFRSFADYRMSQIFSMQGRITEQIETLDMLEMSGGFPDRAQLLFDKGAAAFRYGQKLHRLEGGQSGTLDRYLAKSCEALERYVDAYGGEANYPDALFLLGVIHYLKSEFAKAYDTMLSATKSVQGEDEFPDFNIAPEIYAYFGLAAHRVGKIDLANPGEDANAQAMTRIVRLAEDPQVRLEYARILDAVGATREAVQQFAAVAGGLAGPARADEILEARLSIVRHSLSDQFGSRRDPTISVDDYQQPDRAISELHENCFQLERRGRLAIEKAQVLLALGRGDEAMASLLPELSMGFISDDQEGEVARIIWDVLPRSIAQYRASGQLLLAMKTFEGFRRFVDHHPHSAEIWLSHADLLLDMDLRDMASEVLQHIGEPSPLSEDQQKRLTSYRAEAGLNPSNGESFLRRALDMTGPDFHITTQIRLLTRVGKTYQRDGEHARAAQIFLRGTGIHDISWKDKCLFFDLASQEYEAASIYSKVIETAWKGIRAYEETGLPLSQAERIVGSFLMQMAVNYGRLGDLDKATKAYSTFLKYYPESDRAPVCRYFLAQALERKEDSAAALETLHAISEKSGGESFWNDLATRSAAHLSWEQALPRTVREVLP